MKHQVVVIKLRTKFTILEKDQCVGILVSRDGIGGWDETQPLLAENVGQDYWEAYFSVPTGTRLEWIWIVYNLSSKRVILWESTAKRFIVAPYTDSYMSIPWEGKESPMMPLFKNPVFGSTSSIRPKSPLKKNQDPAPSNSHLSSMNKKTHLVSSTNIQNKTMQGKTPETASLTRIRLETCKDSNINVATCINLDSVPPQRSRRSISKRLVLPITVGVGLLVYTAYRKFC